MTLARLLYALPLVTIAASPATASTIEADFDGSDPGTIVGDLMIDSIGSESCLNLVAGGSASGNALCGRNLDGLASYTISDVDFDTEGALAFSLAAANDGTGVFETSDFITVEANGVEIGTWRGLNDPDQTPGTVDEMALVSGLLAPGASLMPTFTDFTVDLADLGSGIEDLTITLLNTTLNEIIGIDSIVIDQPDPVDPPTAVPLPAGLPLALSGLAALALVGRRRRA